jgi:hypothetical protein
LSGLWIIVPYRLIADERCTRGIAQGRDVLIDLRIAWIQTRYHKREAVSTKRLPQQTREF